MHSIASAIGQIAPAILRRAEGEREEIELAGPAEEEAPPGRRQRPPC